MLRLCFVVLASSVSLAACSSCPTISVDTCEHTCGVESPCEDPAQLCCPTACGGALCVDAVSDRPDRKEVKRGRCGKATKGPWVCSNTCTVDYDCPRNLKCCPNRCEALTCMKPENDDDEITIINDEITLPIGYDYDF